MFKTREKTRTQGFPNKIIEQTKKIKKDQRNEIINVLWNKIKPDDQNKFVYQLPTQIELEDDDGSHKGSFILIEKIQVRKQAAIFKAQKMLENQKMFENQKMLENQKIYALKLFKHKPNKKYLESIEKSIPRNKNLLKYYDIGYYQGHLVNVTQLCDSDLKKEIQGNDQNDQNDQYGQNDKSIMDREIKAIEILKQILNGYFTLLNYGIIHRNLRPKNILLKNGVYKISDFGSATYVKDTSGTNVGKFGYQSPQAQLSTDDSKKLYTSKCDVYSLGIIFYEIIFRKRAFPKYRKVKDIQVITFPDDNISKEVKEFILKCTEIKEECRLSWIEVYNHKIFKGFFKNIVKQLEMIEELNQLKYQVFKKQSEKTIQELRSVEQIGLIDFLTNIDKKSFKKMVLILVFCMHLQDSQYITGEKIFDNQQIEFSRVKMAENGHVACLLTIYTQLIHFPNDSQFFNREKISFNQYYKFLKRIDDTIDKKDVEDSFDFLKEERDVIKTSSFKQLLKFKFLQHENQQK